MRTHRFGKKIKLPATSAIKHQIRTLMLEDAEALAVGGAASDAPGATHDLDHHAKPHAAADER